MKKVEFKKKNVFYKNNKAITLIALVITIIVLLVLAGVTINLTIGEDGIFKIAQQAGKNYTDAQEKELDELDNLYESMLAQNRPENTPETDAGTLVKMPEGWYSQTPEYYSIPDGEKVIASKRIATVQAVADGTGKTVPVPIGFYYVGGTVESGVVISDNPDDQNRYKDAEKGNVPSGVEYKADGTVDETKTTIKGNQFVWIPCRIEDYKKVTTFKNGSNANAWNAGWATYDTNSAEEIQIRKYGGFYIGRYEAGTSKLQLGNGTKFENASTASNWLNENFSIRSTTIEGKITTKAGEIPYYHADYATAIELSKQMYDTDTVSSGLITGTGWDAIMKYITTDNENYSDLKSTSWGNCNNSTLTNCKGRYADTSSGGVSNFKVNENGSRHYGIMTSASTEDVKKNNIYDLAGNLWEWISEAAYKDESEMYMVRGGSFNNSYSDYPVCYREYHCATHALMNFGFRPALYIK